MALLKRKRSGLNDPMSVVTNFVNACNRHDAEGVSACLHPDFDSIQPMYPSRNFRGADQVRRNWQAIFDAEPGFRLTVLRTAAADDTVWLELHGAGRDAEVAGVFVMGIQGDRIRWARIYSALVEGVSAATSPAGADSPSPLRQVPPLQDAAASSGEAAVVSAAAGDANSVEEDLIAPVVDIDGNGRSFRRRSRRKGGGAAAPAEERPEPPSDPVATAAAAALAHDHEAVTSEDSIDPETLVDPEGRIRDTEPVGNDPGPTAPSSDFDFEFKDPRPVEGAPDVAERPDIHQTTPVDPLDGVVDPHPTSEPDVVAEPEPVTVAEAEVMVETMVEVAPAAVVEAQESAEPDPVFFVEPAVVEQPGPEAGADTDAEPEADAALPEPGLIVSTPPPVERRPPGQE